MAQPVGKPTLSLSPWLPAEGKTPIPRFIASLSGLPEGVTAEITLWECDESRDGARRPDRQLGKFAGPIVRSTQPDASRMGIKPETPLPTKAQVLGKSREEGDRASSMLVCIATSAGKDLLDGYYLLKSDLEAFQQGDYWEIYATADVSFAGQKYKLISPVVRLEHVPLRVPFGQATYPPRVGNRLRLYNDGCEDDTFQKGALADMVQAIRDAKHFVFVADWSFHPLFRPTRQGKGAPKLDETIGMELIKKARAGVPTAILTWDHTNIAMPDSQNDSGDDYLADLADGKAIGLTHQAGSNSTLDPAVMPMATAVGAAAASAALMLGGDAIQNKVAGPLGSVAGGLHALGGNQAIAVGVIAGAGVLGALAGASGTHLPTNLFWRKVSRTGLGSITNSHHQKMLIVDYEEKDGRRGIRAFLGGLDLTEGRLDHAGHPVAPPPDLKKGAHGKGDESTWAYAQEWGVKEGSTDEWYNAETDGDRTLPRQPWHDVHAKLEGPSAWDYLREFVGRWLTAGGDANEDAIWKAYRGLLKRKLFWSTEEPLPDGPWTVQVCRSLAKAHWQPKLEPVIDADMDRDAHASQACRFTWGPSKDDHEKSILLAYQRGIDEARRFIYIENQYFIGSGMKWGFDAVVNDIPERIVNKIIERRAAGKPFHAYIVMPMLPEGGVTGPNAELRSYQWRTAQWMIARLYEVMRTDWDKYLSFYFLANWKNLPAAQWRTNGDRKDRMRAHQRYMIYVHTKMMIVDDLHLILGSCNINDRGLTGSDDSEIVISAWPRLKEVETCKKDIQDLRQRLWTEHLGRKNLPALWQSPEQPACVQAIRRAGFSNYAAFREMRRTGAEGHLCLWNYEVRMDRTLTLKTTDLSLGRAWPIQSLEDSMCLPDAEHMSRRNGKSSGWCWEGIEHWWLPGALVK
jgi:phosphatidylserine/phosphatidylglycerophosphate/cardiolipin synthase-like enzyme